MKEENIRVNYKTIGVVEQRGLLEITRDLGKLLTKEEFDEIMMVYNKVADRLLDEAVAETYLEYAYNDDEELLKELNK